MRSALLAAALLLFSSSAFAANEAGKYQAVLGDCAGCHGKNLAGGVTLMTPFGKIVTPNITPDKQTGIGNYSAEDFRKAMKTGMAPGGKRLYPAMPYPYYTRMPDADVDALWSYVKSVKPVKNAVTVNQLRFPFNLRFLMAPWNALFFSVSFHVVVVKFDKDGHAVPVQTPWARGEYLVNGPGHCAACHSPKNFFGADKGPLTGASLQGWFAPDLSGNNNGLGRWSAAELVEYLKTGRNAHAIASGPMAEAVENSTSQMTDSDLSAIAGYLKSLPSSPASDSAPADAARMNAGATVYRINCAACHGLDGKGSALFPPLAGNAVVTQASAEVPVRVILAGGKGAATARAPTGPAMPSLGWRLSDDQVADVVTYIRGQWGNAAAPVSADDAAKIRASLKSGG